MSYGNRRALVGFLGQLDLRLGKSKGGPGHRTTIYLFGGAAAVVAYGAPRATMDLDVLIEEARVQDLLIEWGGPDSDLARRYGLHLQAANVTLMPIEDPDWRGRAVEVLKGEFSALKTMALGKEDLVLSKLGRYSDKDRADIQYLLEESGVDPSRLIRLFKSARRFYAGDLRSLDLTFNVVLREHFNRGPLAF
ncbi:MAG: hypothetical protein HY748_05810 [Elusimicrobia bacterium]|nr:hypothetical protein [Elusimicrobiota bacterium]